LGFICEDLSLDVAQEVPADWKKDTDQILTAIVDGIQASRPPEVRLAAAQALRNSLEFCKGNMDNEGERNVIMQVKRRRSFYSFLFFSVLSGRPCLIFVTFSTTRDDDEGMDGVWVNFQVICEATLCEHAEVKNMAFECIAQVADLYYDKLQPYIQALFELTLACIRDTSSGDAAFQAIEFWNTLCDQVGGTRS